MANKTTAHTPGPWLYSQGAVYASVRDKEGWPTIRLLLADREESKTRPVERDANTNLASLAPELLDTLEECLGWVQAERQPVDPPIIAEAKAVIARAKGEA